MMKYFMTVIVLIFLQSTASCQIEHLKYVNKINQEPQPNIWTGGFSLFNLPHKQTQLSLQTFNDFGGDDIGLTHGESIYLSWLFTTEIDDDYFYKTSWLELINIELTGSTELRVIRLNQNELPEETSKLWLDVKFGSWNLYTIIGAGIKHKNFDSNGLGFFTATHTRSVLHDIISREVDHFDTGKESETSALLKFGMGGEQALLTSVNHNLLLKWDIYISADTYDGFEEEGITQNIALIWGTSPISRNQISPIYAGVQLSNVYNFRELDCVIKGTIGFNVSLTEDVILGINGIVQHGIYDGINNSFDGKNEILSGVELIFTYDNR